MYFELKKVPEKLKLPLVLRAIKDPFAQNWASSELPQDKLVSEFQVSFLQIILERA